MAYSKDVIRAARQRLEAEKADRASLSRSRLQEAYEKVPRLQEIDNLLRKSMAVAALAAFAGEGDPITLMEQAKNANLQLQEERQALVDAYFPAGWLLEGPVCRKCGGEGYIGSVMCDCLKEYCRQEQVKEVSLLSAGNQTFWNFDLTYYSDRIDPRFGASPRSVMEHTLRIARQYAENFSLDSGNLLFIGSTGLGKTHLSAAIAAAAAEKGCSVAYETASHLFSKLEKHRFNPDEESFRAVEKLNRCDLLIVDDLGTELPGNFVTSALYTVINDRLLAGKPIVISTNLTIDEISRRYNPQIASRLQGSFNRLTFVGEDIRVLKNRGVK